MYVRKDYSIIALAESLKRGGDQRKARFERSLSGMTLELLPTADRFHGAAIPSVSFARDLEVGSQAGGQAIVSSSVLPVAAATRPQTILEAGGATVIDLNTTSGTNLPIFSGNVTSSCWIGENDPAPNFTGLTVKSVQSTPKCASSRISYSRRLMKAAQDPAGMERSLLAELTRAVRVEIEEKFLSGLGNANEPKGIYTTPGVGSKTFAAALPTHAELTDMLHTVLDANAELGNLRFILHTSDFANLLKQQIESGGGTTTLQLSLIHI